MLTDAQYALKAATRRAVQMAGGSSAASKELRVDQGRLSRYGSPEDALYVPIDVAAELDKLAGDHVILRAWADMLGFEIVARDPLAEQLAHDVTALAGSIAKESGELISSTIEAIADGALTPREAQKVHDEAADVIDLGVRMQSIARRSMKAG